MLSCPRQFTCAKLFNSFKTPWGRCSGYCDFIDEELETVASKFPGIISDGPTSLATSTPFTCPPYMAQFIFGSMLLTWQLTWQPKRQHHPGTAKCPLYTCGLHWVMLGATLWHILVSLTALLNHESISRLAQWICWRIILGSGRWVRRWTFPFASAWPRMESLGEGIKVVWGPRRAEDTDLPKRGI